jgi:hypothetical protein
MGVCGNPVCLEPKFFASLAQVIYTCNSRKHTVDFAERARRACPDEQFVGLASRGNSKAVVAPTRGEAIEMLRKGLMEDILAWDKEADLSAFTFRISFSEVQGGRFWITNGASMLHEFSVHKHNEGW